MTDTTCRIPDCDGHIHHKRNQLCKKHQSRMQRLGTTELPPRPTPGNCTVDGCDKPVRSPGSDLCMKHYHRKYRHGDVTKQANTSGVTVSHGRRYRSLFMPNHPLAGSNGKVYAHRAALYDKIGPGEHQCHWCNTTVSWDAHRFAPNVLQVDHLNNIGDDNSPDNLVQACRTCNTRRGAQRRHQALRDAGWWSVNDTVEVTTGRKPRLEAS